MKKPVTLSTIGRTFATRGECRAYFRAMRARYSSGEPLNRADRADLEALLHRHPDRAALIGIIGVAGFTVAINEFGARCFAVIRKDGTRALFSLTACLTGRATPDDDNGVSLTELLRMSSLANDPPLPPGYMFAKGLRSS
jgi:Protein of unknown function (DUF3223)